MPEKQHSEEIKLTVMVSGGTLNVKRTFFVY